MAKDTPDYASSVGTPEYEKYIAAQKRIEEILDQRENRLFDPTLLAMAQGFLAPTKTGSFGESLGNVAGAVAPVQANEEKRAMEMAKIRSEMAQQELGMSMQIRQQEGMNKFLDQNMAGGPPSATPSQAPPQATKMPLQGSAPPMATVAAPPMGNAPDGPPMASAQAFPVKEPPPSMPSGGPAPAPAPTPAPAPAPAPAPMAARPPAPQQPQFTGGISLGEPANQGTGFNFTPAERNMISIGMRQGKALPDMIKQVDEMRNNQLVAKEGYMIHKPTNTFIPLPSADQVEIQLPGETSTRKVFKNDAMALSHYGSTGDMDRYRQIEDRIKFGPKNPKEPIVPSGTPAGAPAVNARVATPTTAEMEVDKTKKLEEAKKLGAGSGTRTSETIDKYNAAVDTKNSAIAVKELINQEGGNLVVGVFAKPEIKAALLGMIEKNQFDPGSLSEAYTKLNVKYKVPQNKGESNQDYTERKQAIIDRAQVAFSQMAQLQFQASLLAKGQGTISNNERTLFADTTISKGDSIGSLNKKADMLIKRADFAKAISNELTEQNTSIDKFRGTTKYKEMEKKYEDDLRDILNPNRNKGRGHNAPAGHDDHKAARERANKLLGG
jgi:hypothetical protein